MRVRTGFVVAACLLGPQFAGAQQAGAQQQAAAPRAAVVLDPAAIRRQAAQLSEVRGLLADPDANVRLLAIREIARSGDSIQRQLAIDAGLSSAEAAMQEVALRALLADTKQILVALTKPDGSPLTEGQVALRLGITKFDAETGQLAGVDWNGQIQGAVFTFAYSNRDAGSLVWDAEAGEFRGTANVDASRATGNRKAVWRPR